MLLHSLAGTSDLLVLDHDELSRDALPVSPFERGLVMTNLNAAATSFGQLKDLGQMTVEQYKNLGLYGYLAKAPQNPAWKGFPPTPAKRLWTPQLASEFAMDMMAKAKAATEPPKLPTLESQPGGSQPGGSQPGGSQPGGSRSQPTKEATPQVALKLAVPAPKSNGWLVPVGIAAAAFFALRK